MDESSRAAYVAPCTHTKYIVLSHLKSEMNDLILFAATATLFTLYGKRVASEKTCDGLKNSAFVFVKPHANTPQVQALVREKLVAAGCTILSEIDIDGKTIDEQKLIDQHYYAIASKATLLSAKDIPVPREKFQASFDESWDVVLQENRACNAMEACARFQCSATALDEAWQKAKVVKFGGGFYCGLVTIEKTSLYVFNAFFMTMRSKFVEAGVSIHCYDIEWPSSKLSWSDFRNKVLGPTDPAEGPPGSLRKSILDDYQALGLTSIPNKGDNGVHASASPFEGLAEKINWLKLPIEQSAFGQALLSSGFSKETIVDWSVDPQVLLSDGSRGSIFDALEDMDVEECFAKLVELNDLNANAI